MLNSPALTAYISDTLACLRFFTRLPIPRLAFEGDIHAPPDFCRTVRALPVAGALIGLVAALALGLIDLLALPSLLEAAITLGVLIALTGAMHEDGLADVADGFGGATRERRLEIMRDSRLGTYGVCALALSLILRVAALAALLDLTGYDGAAAALIAGAALTRTLALTPMALLPPARSEGLAHSAGAPTPGGLAAALGLCALIALLLPLAGLGFGRTVVALLAAGAAALGVTQLARRRIGGHTGDVAGAAQQCAEAAFLTALLIGGAAA